jgi:hypothetical protein
MMGAAWLPGGVPFTKEWHGALTRAPAGVYFVDPGASAPGCLRAERSWRSPAAH